jgi:hypothetical protein
VDPNTARIPRATLEGHARAGFTALRTHATRTRQTRDFPLPATLTAARVQRNQCRQALVSLLTDLLHTAHFLGVEFDNLLREAQGYFDEERAEEPEFEGLDSAEHDDPSDPDTPALRPRPPAAQTVCEVCGWPLDDTGNERLPDGRRACASCAAAWRFRQGVDPAAAQDRPRGAPAS